MSGNLALDSNHDILIGRQATRIGGAEYVAQLVKCRLLTVMGEWQNDLSIGLPWFTSLLNKNVRESDVQAALAKVIRETNGVRTLQDISLSVNKATRIISISFTAYSIYGDLSEVVDWQATE